jgi:hypothetical protein
MLARHHSINGSSCYNFRLNENVLLKNDFSKIDEHSFTNKFSNFDWSYLDNPNIDCNNKFDMFLKKTSDFISQSVPRRKLSKKQTKLRSKLWINFDIQKKIKFRDKLFRQQFKSDNIQTKQLYKSFRNRVVRDIRNSKQQYYHKYFNQNQNNMKKLWSGIKSIINFSDNDLRAAIHQSPSLRTYG